MNSITCSHCGLVNWATSESCKRCRRSLLASASGAELSPSGSAKRSSSFSKKWFLAFLLLAIPLGIWQYSRARNQAIISALQKSDVFNESLTVEVYKNLYGPEGENVEAITLRDAGFMNIEEGLKDVVDTSKPWAIPTPQPICPPPAGGYGINTCPPDKTYYGPHLVKVRSITFTFPAGSDISDWKPFETTKPSDRKGWIVPVGGKQLVELTAVEWLSNTPQVYFTWTWKPNQVGRYFDSKDDPPAFVNGVSTGNGHRPRASRTMDSSRVLKATARLAKTADGWEVKQINWY